MMAVPFPFLNSSHSKRRRASVVQHFEGKDWLLAQITSQTVRGKNAIVLEESDPEKGSLKKTSNIRPNKLFTCSRNLIPYEIGSLKVPKVNEAIQTIKDLL